MFGSFLGAAGRTPAPARRPRSFVPRLEALEEREVPAGLVTQDLTQGVTPQQLVSTLFGAGGANLQVSNVKYTGANVAAANFTGGTGIIGFEQGIILST